MADTEIDKDLMKSLQQARKKPRNFAIVARGTTCLKLIVSKKPIKDGELLKAKKEFQGNVVVKGVVSGGDGPELVFQVTVEPSIQDVKFKTYIKEHTGLPLKPRFAVVSSLQEVDDEREEEGGEAEQQSDQDTAPQDSSSTASSPSLEPEAEESEAEAEESVPQSPPQPAGDAVSFTARLKALKPHLDKVLAADIAVSQELKARAGEAGALARNKQFGEASLVLDHIEQLVQQGLEEMAAKPSPEGDPATLFTARLKALMPSIKQAIGSGTDAGQEIKRRASEAGVLAQKKDFVQAQRLLDEITAMLPQPAAGTPVSEPPGPKAEGTTVVYTKARLAWDAVRKRVQAELQSLEKSILSAVREHNADESAEDEYDEEALAVGVKQLYSILDQLDERLIDKLDEALNAEGEERNARHQEAAVIIQEYQAFVDRDPLLAAIDENGFTSCKIQKTVTGTLDVLAGKL